MTSQPSLTTERLLLRPFSLDDAADVQRLAGDRRVAATTMFVPHPYEDGLAEAWIETHAADFEAGKLANFAIVLRADSSLVGAIGLVLQPDHDRAELGYWVGVPYWGQGYSTEAAKAIIAYAFDRRNLHRVHAHHMATNPASGRVMQNAHMEHEGTLRRHVKKWGEMLDIECYGILSKAD